MAVNIVRGRLFPPEDSIAPCPCPVILIDMSKRLRLYDMRLSRLPGAVGVCQSDIIGIARYCNSAQQRLLYCRESGDEGWYGTFAEIVFNVSREKPYITLPRQIARLEAINVCDRPVAVQNQFYEYLQFGNGRMPKQFRSCDAGTIQCLSRNNSPTFVDLSSAPQVLRLYVTDAADIGRRVLLQGRDSNGNTIRSPDGLNEVEGVFITLDQPFSDAPMQFNSITGIQKDITVGNVRLVQASPSTGDEVLLTTLEPGEETSWNRRYYLSKLPCGCCLSPSQTQPCPTVQVTAIAKLEPLPVRVDTDYLLIQNIESIIEEAQAVRYSEMDVGEAKAMSHERHIQAVRFLNGELTHYYGKDRPAINFAPFGTARLEYRGIGTMI